jgi:hypothetical protein
MRDLPEPFFCASIALCPDFVFNAGDLSMSSAVSFGNSHATEVHGGHHHFTSSGDVE